MDRSCGHEEREESGVGGYEGFDLASANSGGESEDEAENYVPFEYTEAGC